MHWGQRYRNVISDRVVYAAKQRGAMLQGPPLEPGEAMGWLKSENLRPTATSLVGRQILVATVRDSAKALERRPLQMQRRKGSLLFRRLSFSVVTPFVSGLARRGGLVSVLALAHGVSPHSQCKRSNDVDQWRFRLPRQQMIIRKLDHDWQPARGELCLRRT